MKQFFSSVYGILMLVFSPITFGLVIPVGVDLYLNKLIYGEYPTSLNYNEYSNWVSNQFVLVVSIVLYGVIWFSIKNFFEKRNIDII